ncbi:MAG: transcription-repair coupling factor [Deltaproteobacteria bacterium]|nr:transcription-repair coupling factor [Deltaproteobacteria bacterium]
MATDPTAHAPLREAIAQLAAIATESRAKGQTSVARVVGAEGALGVALAIEAWRRWAPDAPFVYVTANDETAETRAAELRFFLEGSDAKTEAAEPAAPEDLWTAQVAELPALEASPYAEMQPDRRTIMRRLALKYRLMTGMAPAAIVASPAALFRRVMAKDALAPLAVICRTGTSCDREALVAALTRAGYSRAPLVEDPGTFTVRGAVMDVFPPVYRHPIRIEFFGDDIESIRSYDPGTQRTLRSLDELHIHPVKETLLTEGADPKAVILAAADAVNHPSSKTRLLIEQVEQGVDFFGVEALMPAFHKRLESFFSYLPAHTLIVVEDPDAVDNEARRNLTRLRTSAEHRRAEHRLALDPEAFFLNEDEIHAVFHTHPRVDLLALDIVSSEAPTSLLIRVHSESQTALRAELQQSRSAHGDAEIGTALRARLQQWLQDDQRVFMVAPGRGHAERLSAVLRALDINVAMPKRGHTVEHSIQAWLQTPGGNHVHMVWGPLTRGFRLPNDHVVVVTEEDVFGPKSHRRPEQRRSDGFGDLGALVVGDAIVHDEHGVGRYLGLKTLELRGVKQDFLQLEYDGGTIYLPVYRLASVRRYVGSGGPTNETVKLDKLGGKTWQDKRRRVSAEARKVAEELLQLYAQRKALPGLAFPAPDAVFQEFEESFPFEETVDQAKAIEAVLQDMQAPSPMDRLVCGDVGYGKTEVALRATLLAVLGGKQVAVLAPTTVLAEQHFLTFSERMKDFPVRVGSLSRFRTKAEQSNTLAALAAGQLDVAIGTHRLLSQDVRFRDLGLLVIDEEQRFGVVHKERLRKIRTQVDVLTLTATPIPRTMQMAMGGLREISIIATPPADRLAIRTFVCHFDQALLADAITRELARGGQVFFVHNRVQDLQKWVDEIRRLAPTAKVAMGHGQMNEAELERVMLDFVDGKFDILCSTTIIESGLDIPRANTMIVNRADTFGLAQLYQLRGRIGRSRERAYCYLVIPPGEGVTAEAKQRLAVLQRFTELGAGFQVSTFDLEIRGAGELLGQKQSGAVAAVGFETWIRILEEAVAELRGQPLKPPLDPEMSVDVPAFLPDDYVPETGQRLDFYRRFAMAEDESTLQALLEELQDRYGTPPEEAELLAAVMADKLVVRRIGALGFELGPARFVLNLGPDAVLSPTKVLRMVQAKGSRYKLSPDMRLTYAFDDQEKNDRLAAVRQRLLEIETWRDDTPTARSSR